MRALSDGGVLAVTIWNKEEPPKSVLKLYATMAAASRAIDGPRMADSFFVSSSYLSTATVLYKRGGFTADEIDALRKHTHDMSFDEIYSPGFFYDGSQTDRTLDGYVAQFFSAPINGPPSSSGSPAAAVDPTAPPDPTGPTDATAPPDDAGPPGGKPDDGVLPSTVMGRLAWHSLVNGGWPEIAARYVFDTRKLTNDAPYFAAYVKTKDLPAVLFDPDRLEPLQDEWGYLLIWATLGIACVTAAYARQPPRIRSTKVSLMTIRSFASISSMRARRATAPSVRSGRARPSSVAFARITTLSSRIWASPGVGSSQPATGVPAVSGVLVSVMRGPPQRSWNTGLRQGRRSIRGRGWARHPGASRMSHRVRAAASP